MNINIDTINIWEVEGKFTPQEMFSSLACLLKQDDVLAIGIYNPTSYVYSTIEALEAGSEFSTFIPYDYRNFDGNRKAYPIGRAFRLRWNESLVSIMVSLSLHNSSVDQNIFFDHVLAYREGTPLIPLMDFHDAFNGGSLTFSGFYTKDEIQEFIHRLSADAVSVPNPVLQPFFSSTGYKQLKDLTVKLSYK